jgi:capsid assembly protease
MYGRILAYCLSCPWVIHPEKLRVIEMFLSRKARGEEIPETEVMAAKQGKRSSGPTPPGGVGLLPLHGVMTQRATWMQEWSGGCSTDVLGAAVDQAAADPNIKAIVIDVDSPGGSAYGVAELGDKIAAATKAKKVIAVVNSVAASGAYWAASQASEIVVTPNGEVGSIGCYMIHVDESKALAEAGLTVTPIVAGERKIANHPFAPLSDLGRQEIETLVNDYHAKFVKAVASGRNVSQTAVRDGFGRGGMVRAEAAVKEGMADKIGTLDSVLGRYGVTPQEAGIVKATGRPVALARRWQDVG